MSLTAPDLLPDECGTIEARILDRRVASGRHILELLRGEADNAALIEQLVRYALDVEALCRGRGEALHAACDLLAEQRRQVDRQRERIRDLLEQFRCAVRRRQQDVA